MSLEGNLNLQCHVIRKVFTCPLILHIWDLKWAGDSVLHLFWFCPAGQNQNKCKTESPAHFRSQICKINGQVKTFLITWHWRFKFPSRLIMPQKHSSYIHLYNKICNVLCFFFFYYYFSTYISTQFRFFIQTFCSSFFLFWNPWSPIRKPWYHIEDLESIQINKITHFYLSLWDGFFCILFK